MKRLFIAININPGSDFMRMISTVKASLGGESIRWVDPVNIHLTLLFLGDTTEENIKLVDNVLSQSFTGFGKFEITISGTGIFKNLKDPRLIWAGLNSSPELIRLHKILVNDLKLKGFAIEDHSFIPHITIGRIRKINDRMKLKAVLEKYKDTLIQKTQVTEVILYESILMQTGPLYKPIRKIEL